MKTRKSRDTETTTEGAEGTTTETSTDTSSAEGTTESGGAEETPTPRAPKKPRYLKQMEDERDKQADRVETSTVEFSKVVRALGMLTGKQVSDAEVVQQITELATQALADAASAGEDDGN